VISVTSVSWVVFLRCNALPSRRSLSTRRPITPKLSWISSSLSNRDSEGGSFYTKAARRRLVIRGLSASVVPSHDSRVSPSAVPAPSRGAENINWVSLGQNSVPSLG
jgi:hypothetical protein